MTDKLEQGLIQIYTGQGKGKTTAALGLTFRALGHGFRVCFIQFMKGNSCSGEYLAATKWEEKLDFFRYHENDSKIKTKGQNENCENFDPDFYHKGKHRQYQKGVLKCYEYAIETIQKNQHQLVMLDEISLALKFDLLSLDKVLKLIDEKPQSMELVLTGREMPEEIKKKADLVSQIEMVKHPYQKGISARKGIEY